MDPDLYPEPAAAGSLTAALEATAAELGADVSLVPGTQGGTEAAILAAAPDRNPLRVFAAADRRGFGVVGWSRGGVQMITGGTTDLRDVVRAAVLWSSGRSLREMCEQVPFLEHDDFAAAAERGPAAAVECQWRGIRATAAETPGFPEYARLVEAAYAEPRLRQLFPVTSHWTLGFQACIGLSFVVEVAIEPGSNGCPYRVRPLLMRGVLGVTDSAEEAVAMAVAHLPADLGPAVVRNDDEHARALNSLKGVPDLDEIERWFAAVAEGRVSRDEADWWASCWLLDDDLTWDELSFWALELLCGIDLATGPGGPYLHDDAQVREWLDELRRRRGAQ
ncbi:DUF6193 family natural product biosynthesis protein [Kitasatospora sp. NPDC089509]|uniref:DUF6193 family natural product biosynthesis protein n=1 Tax=Kitasatospora sp. NPDC089509 TaxID=3364079 RepID=UPI00381D9F00